MEVLTGDIWDIATVQDAIVIPTNIGWKNNGSNVMGRGLARDAARRFPSLPKTYGEICQRRGEETPIVVFATGSKTWAKWLYLFPVKPLNATQPYLSWNGPADLALIEKHAVVLNRVCKPEIVQKEIATVYVPALGCGNGGLDPAIVLPRLHEILTEPVFKLVLPIAP